MSSIDEVMSKYVELHKEKTELMDSLRELNRELREISPVVRQYLEETGQPQQVGEEKVELQEKTRKTRKSQKTYGEELKAYLTTLGVSDVDAHVDALKKLKSGPSVQESTVAVSSA